MGREVRKVPPDWQHPRDESTGRYIPLYGGSITEEQSKFMEMARSDGLQAALDYYGSAPNVENYMPEFGDKATHLMMYETCSEGTPLSPAFATPEELAHWLADNGASSFGSMTATYEQWLHVCRGGWAPSAVLVGGAFKSGVAAMAEDSER